MGDSERRSRSFYQRYAPFYDWSQGIAALLRGTSDLKSRREAVRHLELKPGQRVLEVCVGTGSNLPLMSERVGPLGRLAGLDISPAMLRRCRLKLRRRKLKADLIEGEASRLPFAEATFDAVFHFGGLAEFGDKSGAIQQMMRVARPGARIVICDPGLPTDRRLPLVSRLLLKLQFAYSQPPPLDLIPPQAQDLHLTWFRGGAWYLMDFVNP